MLGGFKVVVGLDEEALDAGLDVLADVAGLGKGVAVADGEGDVDLLAQGPVGVSMATNEGVGGNLLEDVRLAHSGRANEQDVALVDLNELWLRGILRLVEVIDGIVLEVIVQLTHRLVMPGELILLRHVSSAALQSLATFSLTFYRMHISSALMHLTLPCEPLSGHLIPSIPLLMVMLMSSPYVLVVVENSSADGLLCAVLADNVVVYALLEVAGVELGDSEGGL